MKNCTHHRQLMLCVLAAIGALLSIAAVPLLATEHGSSKQDHGEPGSTIAAPGVLQLQDLRRIDELATHAEGWQVVSSPAGKYMAWVDSGELRIAFEPGFEPRTLVGNGREEVVRRIHPSPNGRTLFYTCSCKIAGNEPDGKGILSLWEIDLSRGSKPSVVISGAEVPSDMIFSPGGEAFAFAVENDLYEYRRSGNGLWEKRQLSGADPRSSAAIGIGEIAYSPDGERIAYVSTRKALQSYVVIHDIRNSRSLYVQPGIYRDGPPVWSPDGTEVAFVRTVGNWTKRHRFSESRHGVPWKILAANASTGSVRTVWQADPGPGSVPWVEWSDRSWGRYSISPTIRPIWTKAGKIIFPWEKTGWNLMYSVSAKGGNAVVLTPGEGEVRNPVLSPDGESLVFEANFGDGAHRHLWRVSLDGGDFLPLTSGKSVERNPQVTSGGYVGYRVSYRHDGPPSFAVRAPNGTTRDIHLLREEADRRHLEEMWRKFQPEEAVSVTAADGIDSWHLVMKPRTPPPAGGYPVVVYAHGGPAIQMIPGASGLVLNQRMVSQGYMVVNMNYRSGTGQGLDYRLPDGRGATGGSEVKDLAAVARYLKQRGDVNPNRIGIMGASYGGHLVGLAMTQLADDYKAGASLFGVADWVLEMSMDSGAEPSSMTTRGPTAFTRLSERMSYENLAYASSPTAHLEKWRGPVLLTVGELDTQGHVESVIDLGSQLLERGVHVEFIVDPVGRHDVEPEEDIVDFFERNLK